MHAGVLETPVTKNLVGECKKIKGFATAARKVSKTLYAVDELWTDAMCLQYIAAST